MLQLAHNSTHHTKFEVNQRLFEFSKKIVSFVKFTMKVSFLKIQTTSNRPQIWYGGWNCVLIEAYQISPKSETKNFLRFGLVCFGHKSEDERPPFPTNGIAGTSCVK